ncbi:MAG: hypothetical protein JSR80_06225 [Verrucomicrobia bacterium]|nr:hypothetical protein [Verrucomicrobiota bacterium]
MLLHDPRTFSEAFETLTALADIEEKFDWGNYLASQKEEEKPPGLIWLQLQLPDHFSTNVRRLFALVLHQFYELERTQGSLAERKETLHQLKAMMGTVGEAAVRLDRAASFLFGFPERTILALPEYRGLCRFYRSCLMREAGRGIVLGEPSLVRDFLKVEQDLDYELAYLKRDNGSSFLSDHLRQNIFLIADFELYNAQYTADDPLVHLQVWVDEWRWSAAKRMVEELAPLVQKNLTGYLRSAWIALEMAANPENCLLNGHPKACLHYFEDFVRYLRAAVYEERTDFAQALCIALYTAKGESPSLNSLLKTTEGETLAAHLRLEYGAFRQLLEHHPHGPLFKLLDLLRQEKVGPFSPLLLGNMPQELNCSYFGDDEVHLLRLPSPTIQEMVEVAHIDPTYWLFHAQGRHLLINLQDRQSWSEEARALALEELGAYTLASNTDFYHQRALHEYNNDAKQFLDHFFEQLQGTHATYHLPGSIVDFVEDLLGEVHEVFFERRRELSLVERRAFIDLVHFFIVLKLVEVDSPDYLAFVDKDGVDRAGAATGAFLGGLAILRGEMIGNEGALHKALFFAPLLVRERVLLEDRMERLLALLTLMEEKVSQRHLFKETLRSLFSDRVL